MQWFFSNLLAVGEYRRRFEAEYGFSTHHPPAEYVIPPQPGYRQLQRSACGITAGCVFLLVLILAWPLAVWAGDDAPKTGYYVQINAFRERKNADKFLEKLKGKGYAVNLYASGKSTVFYRVSMGPYESREEANAISDDLNAKESLHSIVIRTDITTPVEKSSKEQVAAESKRDKTVKTASAPSPAKKKRAKAGRKPQTPESKEQVAAVAEASPAGSSAPAVAADDSIDVVVSLFLMWKKSWQDRDVKGYLSYYSKNFQPPGETSLVKWMVERRSALARNKKIRIEFSDIDIVPGQDAVEVKFVQRYHSQEYSDTGRKTLVWKKEGGDWKIVSEIWSKGT